MTEVTRRLWKDLMSSTRIQLWIAEHTKVTESWKDIDFIPDFNRFYLIEEGNGFIRIGDTEMYPTGRQLVLMPAGIRQSYSTINDNTYSKYWCHFSATVGDIRLFDVMETPYVLTIASEHEWNAWVSLFRSLKENSHNDTIASSFRVNALLMEIVASFVEQIGEVKFNRTSVVVDKIHTVIQYMEQRFGEPLTIDELAKLIHYHPNYFIQVFKQFTGRSPIQYLNHLRLERAKQWLTATDLSVSEIAERVGMTLFYFSRLFKENSGFTPSGYRQISRTAL
ncbi:AraC family transcriptional regulator [Paenibacillus sp. sptzw28]|uniref:AraC family transcriptional regulator n=1 Tax=Paenibacillus sp. sptzw28 TaxID=715179 RepID=UPI001C6EA67B|nr:AraC family transcriptional regulator [Paenibacillus sp. sptzw28]QYR21621.1 AraC family transcriptional regulator [Paenibacillus sp. sptzw28]